MEQACALRGQGVEANRAGQPQAALRALTAALELLDPTTGAGAASAEMLAERVRVVVTLAYTEYLIHGPSTALRLLDEADLAARQAHFLPLVSRVEYQRATIRGAMGDVEAAWQALERTTTDLSDFTQRERCSVLILHGMVAVSRGQLVAAQSSFSAAAKVASEHGFPAQERLARGNLGYATYLRGDLPRALQLLADADRVAAEVDRSVIVLDRALVMLEAGLVSEAVETLRAGIADSAVSRVQAEAALTLARAHLLSGRLREAAEAARHAEGIYAKRAEHGWAARARLTGLQIALDQGRAEGGPAAEPTESTESPAAEQLANAADDVTAIAERVGDVDLADRARTLAADGFLLAGDLDAAVARLEPGRKGTRRSLAEDLNRAGVTARLAVAQGQPATARRLLTRASGRLAASGRGSASLDLRTASAIHGVRLAALDLDLSRDRGPGGVLASLERWLSVFSAQPSILPADDPVVAELTEQLRSVQRSMRDDPAPAELRRLQRRAGLLEDRIRNRDWSLGHDDLGAHEAPVRIRDARDRLKALDRDLLWFFRHQGRLCGVGIVNGRATVRDLMDLDEATELARQVRVDLRTATTQLLGPFRAAVWGSLRSAAERLDDALVRPWQPRAGGVVLCLDRSVSTFPWHALPSLRGTPVTISASLTSFAAKSTAAPRSSPTASSVHVTVGPGLERAHAEAAEVAALWSHAAVEVAEPSSSASLLRALRSAGIVHVAAHGSHVTQSPLFSTLSLHDGPVFAYEAQRTGVHAGHVVLSACEVGAVTIRPGEESLGMAASLLSLGARSVVAAVAPVPDGVAADVMVRHHRGLIRGLSGDEALATAVAESDPAAVAFLNLGGRFAAE